MGVISDIGTYIMVRGAGGFFNVLLTSIYTDTGPSQWVIHWQYDLQSIIFGTLWPLDTSTTLVRS